MAWNHKGAAPPDDPVFKEGYTITIGGLNVKPEPPPPKKPAGKPIQREK
jgi:hypothetical protein